MAGQAPGHLAQLQETVRWVRQAPLARLRQSQHLHIGARRLPESPRRHKGKLPAFLPVPDTPVRTSRLRSSSRPILLHKAKWCAEDKAEACLRMLKHVSPCASQQRSAKARGLLTAWEKFMRRTSCSRLCRSCHQGRSWRPTMGWCGAVATDP